MVVFFQDIANYSLRVIIIMTNNMSVVSLKSVCVNINVQTFFIKPEVLVFSMTLLALVSRVQNFFKQSM